MNETFIFPLQQHVGAPSIPVAAVGDIVKRGQLIARIPEGALGSPIYTSVSGKVTSLADGAIRILGDAVQSKDYVRLTGTDPLELVKEAGIVGLGGAGFPTYAKINKTFKPGGMVIVNAAECEPILNHNITAIEENPHQLIRGIEIVMSIMHADKAVIVIKAVHAKAVWKLQQAIGNRPITLKFLPNVYPVGEERAVLREVFGTLIPLEHAPLPISMNCVVINSESVCRIQEAVDDKKPFIDKDITVAGKLNGKLEQVFRNVPLGTPVRDVIERAGGLQDGWGELIMGGPFTGYRTTLNSPIIKTTGGIIATEDFVKGPKKIGLLVCACGANQERLEQIAASMGSEVVDVQFCKQAHLLKNGKRKCDNPGHCPGQVQRVMALKKAGAEAVLISNCTDCTNTVMACAPKLHLPVYHCTDGALRAVNHRLIRKMKDTPDMTVQPTPKVVDPAMPLRRSSVASAT